MKKKQIEADKFNIVKQNTRFNVNRVADIPQKISNRNKVYFQRKENKKLQGKSYYINRQQISFKE